MLVISHEGNERIAIDTSAVIAVQEITGQDENQMVVDGVVVFYHGFNIRVLDPHRDVLDKIVAEKRGY